MKKQLLSIVTAVAILFNPYLSFGQAPTLGTTSNFVLFTSNGAVGNTGTTHLTGHVGTNSGSSTGFGNVDGVMHNNNGTTTQAATDLLLAYNQLNSAIPAFFPSPLLGNGDTLTAGVYKINAVTTLNGNLTLNAQGNANAVFIFQIQAAFSTNAAAKVKLINGAQACNVFWKVEGLVSMGSATFMRGTVIANNAAINMNTNDTLEGRALSTAGAISVNGIMAYKPIGCGSATLTGPAAPNLGATAGYAVFSSNGSVSNSGVTYITGDVGTNVGLTTGYNPLYVTGTIHPIPDGSTSACAADLLNVYSYLNTLPHDIELLYPAQFGNNLVLTPHTYLMNAATSFTGSIFLNAQGNADAVFVIKINGALTSSTYSKVILMNGAQSKNIYWKVEGAVNINDYSIFNGTIIANNGAVNLSTGDSLTGRVFTTNGAVTTSAIVAMLPPGSSLPVTWLYFRGKPDQKNVLLEWGTTNEVNNGFFTIEKSRDGNKFDAFSVVNASKENRNGDRSYSVIDPQPHNVTYYRISQTDVDGQKKNYRTIQVKMNAHQSFYAQHYVQASHINLQASGLAGTNAAVQVFSLEGKRMSTQRITLTKEVSQYKVEKPLHKGIYILTIEGQGKKLYTGKVMVL